MEHAQALMRPADNFYVGREVLERSPSRRDGVSAAAERALRARGGELLAKAGRHLGLRRRTVVVGATLFQRFFCKRSFARHDLETVARTALWLATKTDGTDGLRPLNDILQVFYRLEQREAGRAAGFEMLVYANPVYDGWKAGVIATEKLMLKEFGYALHVEVPHKYLLLILADNLLAAAPLRAPAFQALNDCGLTALGCRFRPWVLACGAVFYAARQLRHPLPEDPPWWAMFGVPAEDLVEIAAGLHELHSLQRGGPGGAGEPP